MDFIALQSLHFAPIQWLMNCVCFQNKRDSNKDPDFAIKPKRLRKAQKVNLKILSFLRLAFLVWCLVISYCIAFQYLPLFDLVSFISWFSEWMCLLGETEAWRWLWQWNWKCLGPHWPWHWSKFRRCTFLKRQIKLSFISSIFDDEWGSCNIIF